MWTATFSVWSLRSVRLLFVRRQVAGRHPGLAVFADRPAYRRLNDHPADCVPAPAGRRRHRRLHPYRLAAYLDFFLCRLPYESSL